MSKSFMELVANNLSHGIAQHETLVNTAEKSNVVYDCNAESRRTLGEELQVTESISNPSALK
jgi:hypothetical protein